MTLTHLPVTQGTDEWYEARCGIVTASLVDGLLTKTTLEPADNDTSRSIIRNLAAERITGHVEDTRMSADMERGILDEPYARDFYHQHHAPVTQAGLMIRTFPNGARVGYSPDGVVEPGGLIEIKSRRQKIHLNTVLDGRAPAENVAQLQFGLWVSGREWIDYVSYCGGMALYTIRIHPDPAWHEAFARVVDTVEERINDIIARYLDRTRGLPIPPRIDHFAELTFGD